MFLLGNWRNYDELESSLSIEELMATLNAVRDKDFKEKKFLAALQGVDLEGEEDKVQDVTSLTGAQASKDGFGIGLGLGYIVEENV